MGTSTEVVRFREEKVYKVADDETEKIHQKANKMTNIKNENVVTPGPQGREAGDDVLTMTEGFKMSRFGKIQD